MITYGGTVALHPEGVDRNLSRFRHLAFLDKSPSTRRAWIEICGRFTRFITIYVALHPEGVDRNNEALTYLGISNSRPPPGGRG